MDAMDIIDTNGHVFMDEWTGTAGGVLEPVPCTLILFNLRFFNLTTKYTNRHEIIIWLLL
jgi:hypothetical protein